MPTPAPQLSLRPMDADGARQVLAWRYPTPYDFYNIVISEHDLAEAIVFLTDPINDYYLIERQIGRIEAFCCFGQDAQVPGGDYSTDALDLGLGVRPDLTGQGNGRTYTQLVASTARSRGASTLRVTIATFNQRAQRAWQSLGFIESCTFVGANGNHYTIFTH